jgi:multicomponent Na+:H+ antiporter subunit E
VTGRAAVFVVLLVAWVLLAGELTVANVAAAVLVAGGVLALFPLEAPLVHHRLHPLALVAFLAHVGLSLVTSSAQVVRTVLWPTEARLRAGIVRVDLPPASPLVVTLVANAISLTPGTLTLTATARPAVLHVHVLGLGDPDEFRQEILDLHRRAAAAFTPRAEVAP